MRKINAIHLTILPFKAAVTLATDKVDINGRDQLVEFFATVKHIILTVNGTVVDNMSETRNDSLELGIG